MEIEVFPYADAIILMKECHLWRQMGKLSVMKHAYLGVTEIAEGSGPV